jgi:hypothetical protein
MRPRLDPSISQQIRYLLRKSHVPRVKVQASAIPGAGTGVYYAEQQQQQQQSESLFGGFCPRIVCLYPGIYTPGMPIMSSSTCSDDGIPNEYLANGIPPSGIPFQQNAYVMNLQDCGGYIDGCALTSLYDGRQLDANPSACGHLVNHCYSRPNVELISFVWDDVDSGRSSASSSSMPLPNCFRGGGGPWYYDSFEQKIVRFPYVKSRLDETNWSHLLCGAALALSKPVEYGDELMLDYGLRAPYPEWAFEWYSGRE